MRDPVAPAGPADVGADKTSWRQTEATFRSGADYRMLCLSPETSIGQPLANLQQYLPLEMLQTQPRVSVYNFHDEAAIGTASQATARVSTCHAPLDCSSLSSACTLCRALSHRHRSGAGAADRGTAWR